MAEDVKNKGDKNVSLVLFLTVLQVADSEIET
jgi:hypothetical protein